MRDVALIVRASAMVLVVACGCIIGYGVVSQCGCTPKAVDVRVEFARAPDGGKDASPE
jgi:hypothetical protein